MAYIKDPELIFKKMQDNSMPFYKVLDSDGKSILDQQDDPDVGVDESINRLRDTLDGVTGLVNVVLSDKNKAAKGAGGYLKNDLKFTIKLGGDHSISGINEVKNDSIRLALTRESDARFELLKEKHNAEIAALKKEYETEKRIAALEEKLKDAKDGAMTEKILPYLAGIFGGSPQINGADHQINGTGDTSPKERILNAINRLIKVDKNFVDNLELLASLAENHPLKYTLAVNELKK